MIEILGMILIVAVGRAVPDIPYWLGKERPAEVQKQELGPDVHQLCGPEGCRDIKEEIFE